MKSLLVELTVVLRKEIDQYRRLLTLVREERGRVVRSELAGLLEVVQEKEAITQVLTQLEASRSSLADRLAAALGEGGSSLTLTRVAELSPGEIGRTLRTLRVEFCGVVDLLRAANDVNRTLLDRSLEFVQGSLELLRAVMAGTPTYGARGRFSETASPLAVVNRTA
jgi:flagellar biosynthesis/type III secretory pathway chaperone